MISTGVVLWCLVGLTMGASLFQQLEITTSKALYSFGSSMIHRIDKAKTINAPPLVLFLREGPHHSCLERTNIPKECYCDNNYIGIPPACHPTPEYWDLCVENNPCGVHADCEVTNGTRECSCVSGFEGTPPKCRPGADHRYCELGDPCGPNSECDAAERQCYCLPGFAGNPPNCTPGAEMLALCDPYTCGGYANCSVQDGGPVCTCLPGYLGEAPHCAPGPELWRVCFKDSPCGRHSRCTIEGRVSMCSPCDEGYSGEPPFCSQTVTTNTN